MSYNINGLKASDIVIVPLLSCHFLFLLSSFETQDVKLMLSRHCHNVEKMSTTLIHYQDA